MEELVVGNLVNGDRQERIQAATELSKLSSKQRRKLAEREIIPPLISMLHSEDYEAIETSLCALLSLAFGSERNKIRIVKSGVLPVLLELLQCQSEQLIELAMAALLILSSCAANKLAIASSGAFQLLVDVLNVGSASDENMNSISMQSKADAIATLHNLSTCHQIAPLVVSSGVTYTLLQLVNSSDKLSEPAEKAMALLENIVTSSQAALQETAGTSGALRVLVEVVEEGSVQCKEHAVAILLQICQSCRDTYRGLILREGVMPGLLQLSIDGTWRAKDMGRELLLLLRDCDSRSKQSKHELVEQIMREIDAEGEKISGTALRLVEEMIAKLNM